MSKVLVAKPDSPFEKAIQQIEDIMQENDISMDVSRLFHGDKTYNLQSLCGGSTGMLPRSTDDERFVLRD